MFCEKCGAQLEEGCAFCPNCGNRVGAANGGAPVNTGYYAPVGGYGAPAGAYGAAPAKKKNTTLPLIIGAVALVAVLAVAALLIFNKPYMKPVKAFYEGYNAHSAQMLYQVTDPGVCEYWDLEETFYSVSPVKVPCKLLSKKHLKGDMEMGYASSYGASDAYMVVMQNKLTFYDYDYDEYDVSTFTVCKVNGEWIICEAY